MGGRGTCCICRYTVITGAYLLEYVGAEMVNGRPRLHQVEHPHGVEVLLHCVL